MNGIISVVALGTVVRAAEVVQVGESNIAKFSIAANRSYKKNDEWVEVPTFLDVEVWGKSSDYVTKLAPGDFIHCVGQLEQQNWKSKEGEKRSKLVLRSQNITVISKKKDKPSEEQVDDTPTQVNDEVPF